MDFSNVKFDIIILAGQSNAEGTGYGPVREELMPRLSENIYQLEAEKTVEHLPEELIITYADKPFLIGKAEEYLSEGIYPTGNLALSFAEQYEKISLQENRKVLIVKAAVGGSGFKKGQWGAGKQLYNKMLEMVDYALSLNTENRVVAFLWHQGEHDAFEKNDPNVYKEQLKAVVEGVRDRYGAGIPFLAGDFVNEWKSLYLEDCERILEKIKEVVAEVKIAAFIETSDLLSNNQKVQNGDNIHFCREDLYVLGRRYFEKYQMMEVRL